MRHRILHLLGAFELRVGHADLFALVDERGAPAQERDHRQEGGCLVSVPLRVDAEPADAARLVVVLEHEGVPAAPVISDLRFQQAALELPEVERLRYHLEAEHVVRGEMLEIEDRVELAVFFIYISVCVLLVRDVGFADCVCVVERERPVVQLLQELMHARSVDIERGALLEVQRVLIIPERIHFRDHVEHVEPESVDALLKPETQHVRHLFPDLRVLPVEVRLFRSKEVQVVFIGAFDPLPCRTGERGCPVGRRHQLAFLIAPALSDDVVVAVR